MGVNSLPKTVTRQPRDCNLNPGPSAAESSRLTTRLPSHPVLLLYSAMCRSWGWRVAKTVAYWHVYPDVIRLDWIANMSCLLTSATRSQTGVHLVSNTRWVSNVDVSCCFRSVRSSASDHCESDVLRVLRNNVLSVFLCLSSFLLVLLRFSL